MLNQAATTYSARQRWPIALMVCWPILLGLVFMYWPTYHNLAETVWQTEEQAHGPLILMVVLYLFWQQREYFLQETPISANQNRYVWLGSILLFMGVLLYIAGRSQDILLLDIGSQIPVLAGLLLIARGISAIRLLWFPLLFIVFMVPLPGFLVDAVTGPLKQHISEIAENILYFAGYPIARSGVTLSIGQYQLLVADACSGLHSMFSLSALGFLYLYLMQHCSWLRNGIIIASLLPIAFVANVVRVIVLVLITYHFGDDVGQGFVHKFAGILLFILSLLFLFALDKLLGWLIPSRLRG